MHRLHRTERQDEKRRIEEKSIKRLRELINANEPNKHCAECHQQGPTYVNVTVGSYVCVNCAGQLRGLTHRIKSLTLSSFNNEEVNFLKQTGNLYNRQVFYGQLDDDNQVLQLKVSGATDKYEMLKILEQKYELKKWYVSPTNIRNNEPNELSKEKNQILRNSSNDNDQIPSNWQPTILSLATTIESLIDKKPERSNISQTNQLDDLFSNSTTKENSNSFNPFL
ncbi:hypothetical protein SNEBB_009139 [Seison nebaliae]|nr:hypothetical protein SNEBB_009139 [Seison nebaliae]